MKKNLIINLTIILVLLLAGFLVSHNDSRNYQRLMDRGDIHDGALIFPSKSKQSIPAALQKMQQKRLRNFQIYFIQKKNPDLSYVYMSQHLTKVPMTNGRYFTENDFQSTIPFIILGQDLYKNAYKPQAQAYYQLHGDYYSVIGAAGMANTKKLNRHIFISASPNQHNQTQIRHYQIVVDGNILHHPQHLKQMQHILGAHYSYRSANQINNVRQTWWTRWGLTFFGLIALALIILVLCWFVQVPMLNLLKTTPLKGDLLADFQLGSWFKFFLTEAVTFVIAALLVFLKIPLISKKIMILYFVVLFAVVNLVAVCRILINNKKGLMN